MTSTVAATVVRQARTAASWAAAYLVASALATLLQPAADAAPWYPPLAVSVALLWRSGLRAWPFVLAGEAIVMILQHGAGDGWFLVLAAVETLEALTATWLLRRLGFDPLFDGVGDVLRLAGVAGLTAAAGGLLSAAMRGLRLVLFGTTESGRSPDWLTHWQLWALGDFTGLLTVLPLLLLLARPGSALKTAMRAAAPTGWRAVVPGLIAVAAAAVALEPTAVARRPVTEAVQFLAVLPVLYVAVTAPLRLTVVVVTAVDVAALVSVRVTLGDGAAAEAMLPVQCFMIGTSFCALIASTVLRRERRGRTNLETLLADSPVGIATIDLDGNVRSWNPACAELFGWSAEEVVGGQLPIVTPEGDTAFRDRLRRLSLGEHILGEEVEYVGRDGHRRPIRLSAGPQRNVDGHVVGKIAVLEDLTELRARTRERDELATGIDRASDGVVVTDRDGVITYVNGAVTTVSGYPREELLGRTTAVFRSDRHPAEFYAEMWNSPRSGQPWSGTVVNRRKDGDLVEVQLNICPILDEEQRVAGYVALQRDLSRERALQADLVLEVERRHAVTAALADIRQEPRAEDTAASVAAAAVRLPLVDAAALAQIRSDGAIVPLAATIESASHLATGAPLDKATAEAFLARCAKGMPWTGAGHLPPELLGADVVDDGGWTASAYAPVTWSDRLVGLLACATRAEDGEARLAESVAGLSTLAAHAGAVIGPQLLERDHRDSATARTTQVLEEAAFAPVFQPIVSLEDDEVVGWEALTRFGDGRLPVGVFADARASGRHADLEVACLTAALAASDRLPHHQWLSLNVSPDVLDDPRLHAALASSCRSLVIEITENVEVVDYVALRERIAQLPRRVRVAVDDAGAGYASLRHIIEMGPELVKLDLALIRGIDEDPVRQAMIAGIGYYASQTGATLLAEGVETPEEAASLRRLGVPLAQGYLLGRPMPVDAALAQLPA